MASCRAAEATQHLNSIFRGANCPEDRLLNAPVDTDAFDKRRTEEIFGVAPSDDDSDDENEFAPRLAGKRKASVDDEDDEDAPLSKRPAAAAGNDRAKPSTSSAAASSSSGAKAPYPKGKIQPRKMPQPPPRKKAPCQPAPPTAKPQSESEKMLALRNVLYNTMTNAAVSNDDVRAALELRPDEALGDPSRALLKALNAARAIPNLVKRVQAELPSQRSTTDRQLLFALTKILSDANAGKGSVSAARKWCEQLMQQQPCGSKDPATDILNQLRAMSDGEKASLAAKAMAAARV